MRIVKFWLHNALLLMLITAFLTMQWTTTHIHLAEHHSHEGDHHQHQIETHAHHLSLTEQHTAAIDLSHQKSHNNVIEFNHEYSLPKREKPKNPSAIIIASIFPSAQLSLPNSVTPTVIINDQLSYLAHSSLKIRAPPITA